MTAVRLLGQVFGGLTVIACVTGWACWLWLSGAPWRRNWCGRQWVTRPVRATAQSAATAVVLGVVVAPVATATVLAAIGATLVGSAGAWRLRLWLDQRAEAGVDARPRRVSVEVGQPIPNRPRPAAGEPDRLARQRELEPAR